ncbi:MAG: TrmH family RNA methyltransferase [Acidimicrobiales bacterium]
MTQDGLAFTHHRVRRVRQLLRKRNLRHAQGSLVVEGAELLSAALEAGAAVEAVYVAAGGRTGAEESEVLQRAYNSGARVFDLAPGVVERIADTVAPQPILAVVGYATGRLEEVEGRSMVMVCVDVRDPGNAGTMIRTADAAGVEAVICCEGTVDPTNPKTVRASSGSLFHLPVIWGVGVHDVVGSLKSWGFATVGAVVHGGADYATFDWRRPTALVFGNESSGLVPTIADLLDERVSVPMKGRAESLNVGSSAAVLCFEALRQRRSGERAGDGPGPARPVTSRPASTLPASTMPAMGDRTGEGPS